MPVVSLTAADNGSLVDVQPGDSLEVRLAENPTTGYRWAVDRLESGVLQLEDSPLERSPDAAVGGGGQRVMRFRVVGPGTSSLALKLWRDWEGDSSVLQRFEATVRAGGG
jgi:inhibitor of cysteine peptidase